MTRLRYLLAAALAVMSIAASAQRVSDLPAATALGGTELFPGVQSGVTKKVTAAQLRTYTNTGVATTDASSLTSGTLPAARLPALTGDITTSADSAATTLATVNSNVGSFGSATTSLTATVNGKGLVTAISSQTVTPAVGSITGLGTGVAALLAGTASGTGGPAGTAAPVFTGVLNGASAVFSSSVQGLLFVGTRSSGALNFPDLYGSSGGVVIGDTVSGTNSQIALNASGVSVKGNVGMTADNTYDWGSTGGSRLRNLYVAGIVQTAYATFLAGSAPSAPASGYTDYADSSGRRSWIRASDGFTRTWDSTLSGNRIYALPDASTTIAGLGVAQTFTAAQTIAQAAANTTVLTASGHSLTGSNNTGGYSFLSTLNTTGATYDVFKIASTVTATGANTNLFAVYGGAAGATPSLVIDSANTVRMGANSSLISKTSDLGGNQELATQATLYAMTTTDTSLIVGDRVSDTGAGAGLAYRRARGTAASPTDVVNADQLGYIDFRGYSGTKYWQMASIAAHVDAAVVSGQAPASRLIFATNAANGTSTERMRLANDGSVTFTGVGSGSINFNFVSPALTLTATTGTNITYTNYVNTGGSIRVGRERSSGAGMLALSTAYSGVFNVNSAHAFHLGTNNVIRLTVDSAGVSTFGNVPTSSPAARQVNIGEASVAGTSMNIGGSNGTLASGLGTGTGTPSSLIFAIPVTVASGTGAQTQTTVLTLNSSSGLTLGSAVVTPASTGTRYLCISTAGVVTSSASACSGT